MLRHLRNLRQDPMIGTLTFMKDKNNTPDEIPNDIDSRLRGVTTSDLNESQINEDFVDWLKKKGPFWLAVLAISLATYTFMNQNQQKKVLERQAGWLALQEALLTELPNSLEDVSNQYENIDGLAWISRIYAADTYLQAVQSKKVLAVGIDEDEQDFSDEIRDQYLASAEALYKQVELMTTEGNKFETNDIKSRILIQYTALCGQAAIEEARGNIESSKEKYIEAANITLDNYPSLSAQANIRLNTVENYISQNNLGKKLNFKSNGTDFKNIEVNNSLNELIQSKSELSFDK